MIDGKEKGLSALARDWESIGGTFDELLEGVRTGDEGTLELAAGYEATESLKVCATAFYTIMELHENAQAGMLRPGASLAEIEAHARRQDAEWHAEIRDLAWRRSRIMHGEGDPGPRAGLQATAPTLLSEPRLAEPPAWAEVYERWKGPGRGNAERFLALSQADRVSFLDYAGPLPSRAELAEYDARQAYDGTCHTGTRFDELEADQQRELIQMHGG